MRRHPLTALSSRATAESWCWKVSCTTCGHGNFRGGLARVAEGVHPDSLEWLAASDSGPRRGSVPRFPFPMSLQEPLLELLSSLDLEELRSAGRFPDWLGHLGLYLRYTEQAEREYGTATPHLVPQLLAFSSSTGAAGLGSLELNPLSWRHLQLVEEDLKAQARRPRAAPRRRRRGEVGAADGRF